MNERLSGHSAATGDPRQFLLMAVRTFVHAIRGLAGHGLSVQADGLAALDLDAQGGHATIDSEAASLDPAFDFTTRTETARGKPFLQPLGHRVLLC